MKNRIYKTIGRLFMAALIAAGLTGAAFAQAAEQNNPERSRRQAFEKFRDSLRQPEIAEKTTTENNRKGLYISTLNQTNFNLGSEFVIAAANAAHFETDEQARESVIVNLVSLIDKLEDQPEAAALQKILKSVVRRTASGEQISAEIQTASRTYLNRQPNEQKWYFDSGTAITNLIFNVYKDDKNAVKKDLSEMQRLVKIAPPATIEKIIAPMQSLTNYVSQTTFTANDYETIIGAAIQVFDSVNA